MIEKVEPKYGYVCERVGELTGKNPSIQTCCRLIKHGQLNAKKILGKWMCTRQDVLDYIERQTDAALAGRLPRQVEASKTFGRMRSENARQRASDAANEQLDAMGI